ncbi:MAG TPA: hypothetical protein VEK07_08625 [Polyangiaceae bacterium]|nr:hypothetical protein [Polyangiaceae bacterium]
MEDDPSKSRSPTPGGQEEDEPPDNPFGLLPVIVLVILIVGGLFLAFRLRDSAQMQDCVWSGRKNCAPIDNP